MKRFTVLGLAVSLLLVAGVYFAYADMPGYGCGCGKGGGMMGGKGCGMMGPGMGHEMGGMMMGGRGMMGMQHEFMVDIAALNLDQAQKAAVREIQSRTQKDLIKKRSELQVAMVELNDLLDNDPVDIKAVEAKMKAVESFRTAVHLTMIKAREEIKSKLTSEQKKKLVEMSDDECPMGMTPPGEGPKGPMHRHQ